MTWRVVRVVLVNLTVMACAAAHVDGRENPGGEAADMEKLKDVERGRSEMFSSDTSIVTEFNGRGPSCTITNRIVFCLVAGPASVQVKNTNHEMNVDVAKDSSTICYTDPKRVFCEDIGFKGASVSDAEASPQGENPELIQEISQNSRQGGLYYASASGLFIIESANKTQCFTARDAIVCAVDPPNRLALSFRRLDKAHYGYATIEKPSVCYAGMYGAFCASRRSFED